MVLKYADRSIKARTVVSREGEGGKKTREFPPETSVAWLKGDRTSPIRKFRPCYFRSIRGSRAGEISFLSGWADASLKSTDISRRSQSNNLHFN